MMCRPKTNGEYYFDKLEQRKLNRGDTAQYCYVSPETRALMTTESGAPLLSGEWDWKRIEERVATAFFNFPLYNPTTEEVTPDRDKSRYDRFFEMAIKAKLFTELDKYRRVYDALGISFKPADRNGLHKHNKDVYGELNSSTTTFGKVVTDVNTPEGHESVKTVTDSGTVGTGESVSSGDLSKQTNANTAFDSGTFADVDKNTMSVITPARTVTTETRDAGTMTTTNTSTDSGTEGTNGGKNYTLETNEDVSGWSAYDIETSVTANLEIAKTTISKLIVEDIVSAIICGVYEATPSRPNIPDFIMEKVLWGEYDEDINWDELLGTWRAVSQREIYD